MTLAEKAECAKKFRTQLFIFIERLGGKIGYNDLMQMSYPMYQNYLDYRAEYEKNYKKTLEENRKKIETQKSAMKSRNKKKFRR